MSLKSHLGATGRKLLYYLLAAGVAIGVIFPLFARVFVEPKSDVAWWLFVASCLAAGLVLALLAHFVSFRVSESVLAAVLHKTAGSLGISLDEVRGIDALSDELMRVFANVTSLLDQISAANTNIRALTSQVLAATEQQASGAAEQAAAVTQTSATVEELAQTSSQIADNSSAVVRVAERTLASAEDGMRAVAETAAGIEEIRLSTQQSSDRILTLGERSQEIGRVLSIIDEIAEQTKILALNAAIEAARAGEAGKGFSVVAEEIRKLADSVTESTQEIDRVVREIQASTSALVMSTEKAAKKVAEGKDRAQSTADSLERIVSQVEETTDAAKQISIATQQQRTASDQVVVSMKEVAIVSQQAAQASHQISSAMTELNTLVDSLRVR
ncbi:MAG: methyl-accepting chemotaxis protein [Coriobacteriia bacterium]|nr:methyl-accepting chemotaxis protein [Coriobacteriia bacterium]MBN2822034.1 methyl-accepting chemotaxis protein [Coriobacteriia bacterium]